MREKYSKRRKQIKMNIQDTQLKDTIITDMTGTSLRFYKDGKLGIFGVYGDFDEESLYQSLSHSMDQMRDYEPLQQMNRQENLITDFPKMDTSELVTTVDKVLQELARTYPTLILSAHMISDWQEIYMKNENNLYLNFEDRLLTGKFVLSSKKEPEDTVCFSIVFRNFSFDNLYRQLSKYMQAYQNPVDLPRQEDYKILFSTGNPTAFRKLEKDLQPDMFFNGISSLSGSKDRLFFNECFTLYTSLNPKASRLRSEEIHPFFDWEGSVNQRYQRALIENGVVLTPYTCKQTSIKYELDNTCCAHGSLDSYPYATALGFYPQPSNQDLASLLDGSLGVYICDVDENAFKDNGRFALKAKSLFLCDGENLLGRISPLEITSSFLSMFREGFVGISSSHLLESDIDRAAVFKMNIKK